MQDDRVDFSATYTSLFRRLIPLFADFLALLTAEAPGRAPLDAVKEELYLGIWEKLDAMGFPRGAIAEMWGLTPRGMREALKTYEQSVSRRSRTGQSQPHHPLQLDKVLTRIENAGSDWVLRTELCQYTKDEKQLGRIINTLKQFEWITETGVGPRRRYQALRRPGVPTSPRAKVEVLLHWGWISAEAAAHDLQMPLEEVHRIVGEIKDDDNLTVRTSTAGHTVYRTRRFKIGGADAFEEAVLDHCRAMFRALGKKVAQRQVPDGVGASSEGPGLNVNLVGGGTFSYDLPEDHPLLVEIAEFIGGHNERCREWLDREAEIHREGLSSAPLKRITLYAGQMIEAIDFATDEEAEA